LTDNCANIHAARRAGEHRDERGQERSARDAADRYHGLGDKTGRLDLHGRRLRTTMQDSLGYDPEFRNVSPGMVLIMRVIEGFCNRANGDIINELDFGLGHAEYKESLRSDSWVEAAVYVFSPTLKGLVLKSARTTTRLVDASARRMLSSTDFWPRLKRTWRDRLAKRANGRPNAEKPDAAAVPAAATSSAHK